jgi:hypothetical protein
VEKLEFHWVVPSQVASVWKAKVPRKYTARGKESILVDNQCLEKQVVQYVLPMEIKTPSTEWDLNANVILVVGSLDIFLRVLETRRLACFCCLLANVPRFRSTYVDCNKIWSGRA